MVPFHVITLVGFDLVAAASEDERGDRHQALHRFAGDMPLKHEACRSGLGAPPQIGLQMCLAELGNELVHAVQSRCSRGEAETAGLTTSDGE